MGQGRKSNSAWRFFGRSVANWQPPVVLEKLPSNRARRAARDSRPLWISGKRRAPALTSGTCRAHTLEA